MKEANYADWRVTAAAEKKKQKEEGGRQPSPALQM